MSPSRHLVARALQLIPTHRQTARARASLVDALGGDQAAGVIDATLTLLNVFGALQQGDLVRSKDQQATYLIQSLRLWLAQTGDDETLITSELIRAIEERRVQAAERAGVTAQPARVQAAAFVLIGRAVAGEMHVLCQLDRRAGQYQLIGGRLEPDETAAQAAEREFMEEVGAGQQPPLQAGAEVVLHALLDAPIVLDALSATYGALTRYQFHVFHACIARAKLMLGPDDAWIAISDLLSGQARDGKQMGDPRLFHEINARIIGGLASVAPSESRTLGG